jgi:circadian clock protein KaiC
MFADRELVATGIPSLDTLLAGGIPRRQSLIITGNPGTGKTILGGQIVFGLAQRGVRVVLATVTSEPHDKLVTELRNFSFFDADRIGEEIFLLSAYPWVQKGPREAKEGLLKMVKERQAGILFIDGLRSVRDLWQDEARMRDFLYEMNVALAQTDTLGIFTTEYPLERLLDYPEATTVDGIISMSCRQYGERIVRRAQVVKLRGRPHLTGQHVMHITSRGIEITPRLESVTVPPKSFTPPEERVSFGLPELDGLMAGGLYRHTTTIMAGSTGIGKTLLAAHFVANGALSGEPSMFISLSETGPRLAQRARRIGLDLAPALATGNLALEYVPAIEMEADDLAAQILRMVEAHGTPPRRLVIDGLTAFEESLLVHKERARTFLSALIMRLRDLGCTTVFIKEVATITGPELDFSDSPISILAENVIFLRHLELRGRLHRIISILKMHDSESDPNLREFVIGNDGLRVVDPIHSAEGLLTGIGRPVGGWDTARDP